MKATLALCRRWDLDGKTVIRPGLCFRMTPEGTAVIDSSWYR
uniref:Uncharacterized protein n=1 Tax=Anguilla anguilla TaxID=7936 RepID=A0A0E9Q4U5_ANGAN